MKKIYTKLLVAVISIVFISAFVFAAKPDLTRQAVEVNPSEGQATVFIPAHAKEVAPGVFSLGQAQDIDGRVVQGYLFVRNKKENAKPPWAGGGNDKGTTTCYEFLAKGAKWKQTEQYITGVGVDVALTQTSLDTWNEQSNIFGARDTIGFTDGADDVSPDGKNEVELVNLGPTNTIAYTIVWGIWGGRPSRREIVEWDAVFNTAYPFGDADANPSVMDYQNIATHEFGHAAGLGHPDNTCTEETMYAYAGYGETNKRDLFTGDIAGINELY